MFNGRGQRRPVIDLGGSSRSRRLQRDDLFEKREQERLKRRQHAAVLTIQAYYRGRYALGRARAQMRTVWDDDCAQLDRRFAGRPPATAIIPFLRKFLFIYRPQFDGDRFFRICAILLPMMSQTAPELNITSLALDEETRAVFVQQMTALLAICCERAKVEGCTHPTPTKLSHAMSMLLCVTEGDRWVLAQGKDATQLDIIRNVCGQIQQALVSKELFSCLRPYLLFHKDFSAPPERDFLLTSVAANIIVRPFRYPLPRRQEAFEALACKIFTVPLLYQRLSPALRDVLHTVEIWDGMLGALVAEVDAADRASVSGVAFAAPSLSKRSTSTFVAKLPYSCTPDGTPSFGKENSGLTRQGPQPACVWLLGNLVTLGMSRVKSMNDQQLKDYIRVLGFLQECKPQNSKTDQPTDLLQLSSLNDTMLRELPPSLWTLIKSTGQLDYFAQMRTADASFLAIFTLFCECAGHLLKALDDDEFFREVYFSLADMVYLTGALKTLVFRMYWERSRSQRPQDLHLRRLGTELLVSIYRRDVRRRFCPPDHWLVDVLKGGGAFSNEYLSGGRREEESRTVLVYANIPFVIPFSERVAVFREQVEEVKDDMYFRDQFFGREPVRIRRDALFEDGFRGLNNAEILRRRVYIMFIDSMGMEEMGIDGGGVFKEFLTSLVKTAYDPNCGLFCETPDRFLYPNYLSKNFYGDRHLEYFVFLGRMAGKALWEGVLVELPLASFFLSKILGHASLVNDVPSLDPELHKNLIFLMTYDGDWKDLALTFTIQEGEHGEIETELIPNGRNIAVDGSNVHDYIFLTANHRLNVQIRDQCSAFVKGLSDVIDLTWIRSFNEEELRTLMSGVKAPIDLADLRANTVYSGGYDDSHPVIVAFWEVVGSFTEEQRASLLKFVTSVSRPPLLGFKECNPRFTIHSAGRRQDRLPTASTCMNLLKLPEYASAKVLREKLLQSIEAGAGFDLS